MESRLAERKDAQTVVNLWSQLIVFYGDSFSHYGQELDRDLLFRSFYHMLEGEDFRILVLEIEEVLATCTLHLNRFSSWSSSCYGSLEDFVVHEDWRGQDLGTVLLTFALKEAEGLGLSRLELHVLGENLPAKGLYEKKGFLCNGSLVYCINF